MQISEYICKIFFEELAIFLKFLWKIIAACNVSKMLLFHRYFLSSFKYMQRQKTWSFSKFFQSNQIQACFFNRYTKQKMQIFNPIARDNAFDTANGCQMMS